MVAQILVIVEEPQRSGQVQRKNVQVKPMECIDARAVGVRTSGAPGQCWVSGLSPWADGIWESRGGAWHVRCGLLSADV